MGIPIPGKDGLYIEMGRRSYWRPAMQLIKYMHSDPITHFQLFLGGLICQSFFFRASFIKPRHSLMQGLWAYVVVLDCSCWNVSTCSQVWSDSPCRNWTFCCYLNNKYTKNHTFIFCANQKQTTRLSQTHLWSHGSQIDGSCKKDITPLLTHWSYFFLAITWFTNQWVCARKA